MKLTYFQVEQHLKSKLAPIYIVSGDEILLKQDVIQSLRKAAKASGFTERTRITPEAGFDWEELYNTLYANSMLAEKRIIELDFRDSTPNKTASPILQAYAEHVVNDNLLIIDIGKIDDKIARSAWYKALEKVGMVIAIWPIPREQLPQWIMNRAKKYKLQLQPDAVNLLADYIEGNLVAAAQAIEKVYLLQHDGLITSEIIETILMDESRFTVFDFIEHLIAGNKEKALHILNVLKEDGTEAVLVLWAITRELRMLAEMAQQLKQGSSHETLFQKHRIFAKRQMVIRKFLNTFSAETCLDKLSQTLHIDRIIKGAARGNVWNGLEMFCLGL